MTQGESDARDVARAVLTAAALDADVAAAERVPWATDGSVFRVVDGGGRAWALRVRPAGRLREFEAEAEAIRLASAAGVPVPSHVTVAGAGRWCVMRSAWVDGHPLGHAVRERPDLAAEAGAAMADIQARIHEAAAAGIRAGWLARGAAPPPSGGAARPVLVHLDFHPQNVLWSAGAVAAVLDWTNAGRADPRTDLARTRALFALGRALEPDTAALLDRAEAAWRGAYEARMGAQANMTPFLRWGAARTAEDLSGKLPALVLAAVEHDADRPW